MSLRKQILETHRSRRHLTSWMDRHVQGPGHKELVLTAMVEEIVQILNVPMPALGVTLSEPPLGPQIHAFLYEEMMLRPWNSSGRRPIDDFIAKQAWRERPVGRQFLKTLAQSTPRVWEIVDVGADGTLSIRRLSKTPKPKDKIFIIHDDQLSRNSKPRDCVVGRVLRLPAGRIFAESVLPLTRQDAVHIRQTPQHDLVLASFVAWCVAAIRELDNHIADKQYIPSEPFSGQKEKPGKSSLGNNRPQHKPQPTSTGAASIAETSSQPQQHPHHPNDNPAQRPADTPPIDRAKLLERIRKLFTMAQETEASPHEAEIALRRCQKLMARYGIQESDLHRSQFSADTFRAGNRVPMHVKWLAFAVRKLHDVLYVTGGEAGPEFRGYEIDVRVAMMTMEYLEDATERSLSIRRQAGNFPAGRSASYDYRVSFATEVYRRVLALVNEREASEDSADAGNALTVRKREIVNRECRQGIVTTKARINGARPGAAADAGRTDGSKVSLAPQVPSESSLVGTLTSE